MTILARVWAPSERRNRQGNIGSRLEVVEPKALPSWAPILTSLGGFCVVKLNQPDPNA